MVMGPPGNGDQKAEPHEEDRAMDKTVYYDSYKEERDLILEYNQVDLGDARITNIMGHRDR